MSVIDKKILDNFSIKILDGLSKIAASLKMISHEMDSGNLSVQEASTIIQILADGMNEVIREATA